MTTSYLTRERKTLGEIVLTQSNQ